MIDRLSWRGGLAAGVFVVALAGLTGDASTEFQTVTPWLISFGALAALMWAFGRKSQ